MKSFTIFSGSLESSDTSGLDCKISGLGVLLVVRSIQDTDKAKNITVDVTGSDSLAGMEELLLGVASELGLGLSHTTSLSEKKYPGNGHWHFKQDLKESGCLDVTCWPDGSLFWITVRNREPDWVHAAGVKMSTLVNKAVTL